MQCVIRTTILPACLLLMLGHAALAQNGGVSVEDKGTGLTEESAKLDAMRNALGQGAGLNVSSFTRTENFELVRDAIYARADGFVSQVKVLGYTHGVGGLVICRIRAVVNKGDVQASWGAIQNVLDQIGRPGMMVYVKETIDGVLQEGSVLETKIESRFSRMGFDLYDRSQLEAIEKKDMDDAELSNNMAKIQAIAKRFHTQIFITGYAHTSAAGASRLAGQAAAMYNADGQLKMYHTDTGKIITTAVLTNCRGGSRTAYTGSQQAGRKALLRCADEIADELYWSAMASWSTRISSGGTIVVEIEGVSVVDAIHYKRNLEKAAPDKIKSVNKSTLNGIATFRIKTTLSKDDLIIILSSGYFENLFTFTGEQGSKIQAIRNED